TPAAEAGKLHDDPHHGVRTLAREVIATWQIAAQGQVANVVPLLDRLLTQLASAEGDDLIVAAGKPVFMKKVGRVSAVTPRPLDEQQVKSLILPHLTTEQMMALQALEDVDYSHEV